MSERILSLSRIRVKRACPHCGSPKLQRSSRPANVGESMNGESLWDLTEACTMCAWSKSRRNVKIGV